MIFKIILYLEEGNPHDEDTQDVEEGQTEADESQIQCLGCHITAVDGGILIVDERFTPQGLCGGKGFLKEGGVPHCHILVDYIQIRGADCSYDGVRPQHALQSR